MQTLWKLPLGILDTNENISVSQLRMDHKAIEATD